MQYRVCECAPIKRWDRSVPMVPAVPPLRSVQNVYRIDSVSNVPDVPIVPALRSVQVVQSLRSHNTEVRSNCSSRSIAALRSNRLGFLGLGEGTSTFREFPKRRNESEYPCCRGNESILRAGIMTSKNQTLHGLAETRSPRENEASAKCHRIKS